MSVIRLPGDVLRVAFNRDELRTRPTALPPELVKFTTTTAMMPIDPQSGGTWIAGNDFGLIFAVLNVTLKTGGVAGARSRGTLIPSLVEHSTFADVVKAAAAVRFADFAPFRLVVLDHARYGVLTFDGARAQTTLEPMDHSLMFTSSGLGDRLVEPPRRELFERMIPRDHATVAQQNAFHAHGWPDRPELSVRMSRADARTVSVTTIQLGESNVQMSYRSFDQDQAVQSSLPLREICCDNAN